MTFIKWVKEMIKEVLVILEEIPLHDRDPVSIFLLWFKLEVFWLFSRTRGFTIVCGFFSLKILLAALRDAWKQSFFVLKHCHIL